MTTDTIEFNEALAQRYLAYALSTIMSRALPDVRDGLKPVHRRLLYAMYELKLQPQNSFKKSARVVGDVMGKFHPHGDSAIYDALVRLAQDFSVRYPLIEGQGNFGNIDGDNAAAMRYTEARLTDVAILLLEGIDEETVDFTATYDEESQEPLVFPASFPNLLANGSSGIAVGMATSIPPHNLYELCQALIALLENPTLSHEALLDLIPGPDFPTGGVLIEPRDSILKAYTSGKGSFRIRAKWHTEEIKGGGYHIIITDIPYQVQKSKLLEKMADLLSDKKLPHVGNFMDESAEDLRIVIEPKTRNIDPQALMASLFKQTDLDIRIPLNMNVLSLSKKPEVLSLKDVLSQFLTHRFDVLLKRSHFRLRQICERLEILKGFLIAYLNLDEVIHIIREADHPKDELIKRFSLTEPQAEGILNMRLRALRKIQEIEIRKESEALSAEKDALDRLVSSEALQKKALKKNFLDIAKRFSLEIPLGRRRTLIGLPPEEVDIEESLPLDIEPVTIVCSEKGWARCLKGHVAIEEIKYKEGDAPRFAFHAQSHQKILFFSQTGRAFTVNTDKLPGGRGQGDALRHFIDLSPQDDVIQVTALPLEENPFLLMSHKGKGFCIQSSHLVAQTRQGKQIFNCGDDDHVRFCFLAQKSHIAMMGTHRKLLIQPIEDIPDFARGAGVTLQKYKDATLSDAMLLNLEEGLTFLRGLKTVTERNLLPWLGKRGSTGKLAPLGFPRTNKFS